MDGEGNFNWRFVYQFDYFPAEQSLSVKKKEHFWSMDVTEVLLPPVLNLQIWDNDKFTPDDFLGKISRETFSSRSTAHLRCVDVGSQSIVQTSERRRDVFRGDLQRESIEPRLDLRNETTKRLVAVRRSSRWSTSTDGERDRQ